MTMAPLDLSRSDAIPCQDVPLRARYVATMREVSEQMPFAPVWTMQAIDAAVQTALGLPYEPWQGDAAYPEEWTMETVGMRATVWLNR